MTRTCRATWLMALMALVCPFWLTASAEAQFAVSPDPELSPTVYLDEADNTIRSHLARIDAFLTDKQWDEAVETVRRVLENDGEKLIRVEPLGEADEGDFARYLPVRQYCQMLMAGWHRSHPEALQLYRSRVDPLARRWYEQGVAQRDAGQLERVVEQLFVSSYGDQALLALGEMALERADYTAARSAWERTSPLLRAPEAAHPLLQTPPGRPLWLSLRGVDLEEHWEQLQPLLTERSGRANWLAYPDTELDLAEVRARLVLVSILEGSLARARFELDLLGRLHPEAEGRLGGREGKYVELLGELLEQSEQWPAVPADPDWTTFGGALTRQAAAEQEVDIGGPPLWELDLPVLSGERDHLGEHRRRVAEGRAGLLSYHPLVVGDRVLVHKGRRVEDIEAVDLYTGEPVWPASPWPMDGSGLAAQQRDKQVGVARFTMTAHGNRLYARIGSPVTGIAREEALLSQERGQLVVVDLEAERRRLLTIRLEGPDWGPQWAFEGPPVTDGANLYVALRRRDDVRAQAHVACFDAQRGQLRWRRLISTAETPGLGQWDELSHNLLSLHQGVLYYNTNLGTVAALRAGDGSVQWITRYPRAPFGGSDPDRSGRHFFRDLSPCLLYKGLVIAAPGDCDRLFALDAGTGQLLWSSRRQQAGDAVHLLGVGQGNLIASGDALYWFDVHTGQAVGQFPYPGKDAPGHGRPDPVGFGRGLLAGNRVYWPTREKIYVFEQQTLRTESGWRPMGVRTIELTHRGTGGGNLLIAGDVLLIATADRLIAFNTHGRPPAARQDETAETGSGRP